MSARILIVEDEEPLSLLLRYNLEADGYEVDTVARGDEADTRLRESTPDLVVLDWMLPGLSGIELCRRLRARPETKALPIIMLTARGEESERIRGLSTGADDYIVKPFSVPELIARVRALLRRASPERVADVLAFGDIELDREKKRVSRAGREVALGPTEYRLLEFLMERPGRVFSREQLLDSVWASMALPGLFPPIRYGDKWLVDGGLVNPVPISLCRALGADIVIAVNLNGDIVGKHFVQNNQDETDSTSVMARFRKNIRAYKTTLFGTQSDGHPVPSLFDVISGSLHIAQDRITRSRMAGDPPDVLLSPRLSHIGLLEFYRAEESIQEGRACVTRVAAEISHVMKQL